LGLLVGAAAPAGAAQQTRRPADDADEPAYDKIVEDFIQYDIGRIRDRAAIERIRREFNGIQAEAVPALVRGLNKAMRMRASCPITAIAGKLNSILNNSQDAEIGMYVLRNLEQRTVQGYTQHIKGVFTASENQVVRVQGKEYLNAQLKRRMEEDQQRLAYVPGMKLTDLAVRDPGAGNSKEPESAEPPASQNGRAAAAQSKKARPAAAPAVDFSKLGTAEVADRLKDRAAQTAALAELNRRAGSDDESEVVKHADVIIETLKDGGDPARESAARLLGLLRCQQAVPPLIDALECDNPQVRSAASTALTRITRQLFGPSDGASREETERAIARWRVWLAQQRPEER
jgi:hypothetical protein